MILADFNVRPLASSRFRYRVRVFSSKKEMCQTARAENSIRGEFIGGFAGYEKHERVLDPKNGTLAGDFFFWRNSGLFLDIVHEIGHGAVFYARDIQGGDLNASGSKSDATDDEEVVCRSLENLTTGILCPLAKIKIPVSLQACKN